MSIYKGHFSTQGLPVWIKGLTKCKVLNRTYSKECGKKGLEGVFDVVRNMLFLILSWNLE